MVKFSQTIKINSQKKSNLPTPPSLPPLLEVSIGGLTVTSNKNAKFRTYVGSCIALCIYDSANKIAGMAHVVIPKNTARKKIDKTNEGKFGDEAVKIMLNKMSKKGANLKKLKAQMAGGATIFTQEGNSTYYDIGSRNIVSLRVILKKFGVQLISQDVGKNKGRWVVFDLASEKMRTS